MPAKRSGDESLQPARANANTRMAIGVLQILGLILRSAHSITIFCGEHNQLHGLTKGQCKMRIEPRGTRGTRGIQQANLVDGIVDQWSSTGFPRAPRAPRGSFFSISLLCQGYAD